MTRRCWYVMACHSIATALGCSFIVANYDLNASHGARQLAKSNWYSQHRGPDATNWVNRFGWTFGHNLLSMTGVFTLQPFFGPSTVALFNGEIYNFQELSQELTGDANTFASDGQVLLPAYARWGNTFVRRLKGEFAIVLVDYQQQSVLLSTDVFSTKPLWYSTQPATSRDVVQQTGLAQRFIASTYESVLIGLGVPRRRRHLADANEALVIPFSTFQSSEPDSQLLLKTVQRFPLRVFDLTQYKTTTKDWQHAFLRAVHVRTARLKHKVFIGLSSGYDSGALALALRCIGKPHLAYSMEGKEDMDVLRKRGNELGNGSWHIIRPSKSDFSEHTEWLREHIETFHHVHYSATNVSRYRSQWSTIVNDRAAIGLSMIIHSARQEAGLVYLSGAGADEIISDYSIGPGECVMSGCCNFDGRFPANLSDIYPHRWANFYGGLQRANLMREELTAGARGVEGRYPFLDPDVVQEYLWLSQSLKNSEYKRPIADFMREQSYPNRYKWKSGFVAYADTEHWKQLNSKSRLAERRSRDRYLQGATRSRGQRSTAL